MYEFIISYFHANVKGYLQKNLHKMLTDDEFCDIIIWCKLIHITGGNQ